MSEANRLDDRLWKDERGNEWFLCDSCDAAISKARLFVARVMDYRLEEAGAFYCRPCAEEIMSEWAKLIVPFEDDE